ncbi:SoxR reducing system RseC family protein [candidate division WOR-3 bacterium]|nr:SoxR reducing system RseC family protein [candidate division WOR-3 bacterium]
MQEDGIIIKIDGQDALVEVNPEGCITCTAKAFCSGGEKRIVKAENKIRAKLGDKVTLKIPRRGFYLSLSLIFIIPIVLLFGGFIIFYRLLGEGIAGLIGLILLIAWFIALKWIDKIQRDKKTFKPKIITIYDKNT